MKKQEHQERTLEDIDKENKTGESKINSLKLRKLEFQMKRKKVVMKNAKLSDFCKLEKSVVKKSNKTFEKLK